MAAKALEGPTIFWRYMLALARFSDLQNKNGATTSEYNIESIVLGFLPRRSERADLMILMPSRVSTDGCPWSRTITETSNPLCLSAWAKSTCWSSAPPAIGILACARMGYELKEIRHILGLIMFRPPSHPQLFRTRANDFKGMLPHRSFLTNRPTGQKPSPTFPLQVDRYILSLLSRAHL